MEHKVFSVFDEKAKCFMPPFYQPHDGMALRVFSDACRADDHPFGKNPEDYSLYGLGTFDDVSGTIVSILKPKMLLTATEVLDLSGKVLSMPSKKEISNHG